MDITLYKTTSERERITKTLTDGTTLHGSLKAECSVISPKVLIEAVNPTSYNYCYIPDFGRYYHISEFVSVRTNLWLMSCDVDVLMSYANAILALNVVIKDNSVGDIETYMQGKPWQATVKTKTDVVTFPSGLLDSGEYILITSGGVAS